MLSKIIKTIGVFGAAAALAASVNAYDDWDDDYYFEWHNGEYVSGDFYYNENSDGTVTVTEYAGSGVTELEIPTQLDGKTVTRIDNGAFYWNSELKKVVIPDSVTAIGSEAFRSCVELEEVALPANIREIPSYCFCGCVKLKRVEIPDRVISIGYGAFENCLSLEEVRIPSSVDSISYNSFRDCDMLTIYCRRGSEAAEYAKSNEIDCVEEIPPAGETAMVLGIVGTVWGIVAAAVIGAAVFAKKREK